MIDGAIKTKGKSWYQRLIRGFWKNPNRLTAAKVMITTTVVAIPAIVWGNLNMMVALSLGVVAAALSETDDHPKGRYKALVITIVSFAITTLSVFLLKPYPVYFGIGFIASTILFVLIGGISERYRGISYGAVLIGIYAMLGYQEQHNWHEQSLYLCAGALFYGLLSLILLARKPWRPLEEQLSGGFIALSNYLEEKANNFPYEKSEQANKQAILNIQVVTALEKCKEVINIYSEEVSDQKKLIPYLQRFMLLQSLHERAASAHEEYEELGSKAEYKELLEGFSELLHQLSHATQLVAEKMLTGEKYEHPVSIGWIVNALEFEIDKLPEHDKQLLELLLHNLTRSHQSLSNLNKPERSTSIPRLGQDTRSAWKRFTYQLSWSHPRLRYAIRLSSCFLIEYLLIWYFKLPKGEWMMLTTLFVSQPTYSETRKKLFDRIIGTVTGVGLGILALGLLPTQVGQILLLLTSIYSFFYWRHLNYSYAVVFISIFVLAGNQLTSITLEGIFIPRIMDTLAGALFSFLAIRFLWPNWQHKQIPNLLAQALQNNAFYFKQITENTENQNDDYDYRLARRLAHKSDNALTLAWQSMQVEPKKREHATNKTFTLTYLNHALLSHLSALGAFYDEKKYTSLNNEFDVIIEETLNKTAEKIKNNDDRKISSLKPVLIKLKNIIDNSEPNEERQYLRLKYNIAAVSNKLVKQSKKIKQLN
ncbi:FUSC family membrane protein [Labilibacter marinus]|uniref:FUSC family membrane protein n=1 Tax=Labilibacter marinus TaxID=1477105 RepID=UPI00094F8879|nr:FUSC family membrane protein [Labilibacter marinus]